MEKKALSHVCFERHGFTEESETRESGSAPLPCSLSPPHSMFFLANVTTGLWAYEEG